jgi:hypothetical protein
LVVEDTVLNPQIQSVTPGRCRKQETVEPVMTFLSVVHGKTNIDGAKAAIVVVASLEDLGIEEGYKCGETRREAVSKKVKGLEHGGVNAAHSSTCDVCVL